MKLQILVLVLFIAELFGCQSNQKEIRVKGKFIGELPDELQYSVPVNGICYEFFNKRTKVDSLGNFEFSINTEEPCFISLFLKANRGQLIVEPGKNYEITIDSNGNQNNFKFTCHNERVQEEYQKLFSPLHPQSEAMKFWDLPLEEAKSKIDAAYNNEMSPFESLLAGDEMSSDLFNLIQLDRKIFYSAALGQVATFKFVNEKRKNLDANTDSINEVWKEAVSEVPLGKTNFLNSKWAYYYLQSYLLYNEYTTEKNVLDIRSKAREEDLFHTYLIDIVKNYLKGDVLEFYTAAYILSAAQQELFEKELIDLFEDFKTDFLNSNYTQYLEPEISKIVDFHEKAAMKVEAAIKFVDGYENFETLEQCLAPFKGSKVYMDIWATFCGPCKDEFKHANELEQMLTAKNIKQLYISTDSDKYEKRWKEMINYYDLKGYHVRADKDLKAEIKNLPNYIGIPHYLIIDKNGNIVVNNAKRPSQLEELEKQIKEIEL